MNQRSLMLSIAVLLCLSFTGCAESRSAQEAVADPVFEPRIADLGTVPIGESRRFAATLVNHSASKLEIASLEATCGCMDLDVDKRLCDPGESIELTGALRPQYTPHDFRHHVQVHAKNPSAGPFTFELMGKVLSNFSVTPETAELRPDLIRGTAGEASITVQNNSERTVRVQDPMALASDIHVRIDKHSLAHKEQTQIRLSAKAVTVTPIALDIQVPTSLPTEPFLTIKAIVQPLKSVSVSPQAIRLGVVKKAELLQRGAFKLHLSGSLLPHLKIKDVQTPSFMRYAGSTGKLSDSADLSFDFIDSFPGLTLDGAIIFNLEFTRPDQALPAPASLRIPVSGILNDG